MHPLPLYSPPVQAETDPALRHICATANIRRAHPFRAAIRDNPHGIIPAEVLTSWEQLADGQRPRAGEGVRKGMPRSPLFMWQQEAVTWAREHPDKMICLSDDFCDWTVAVAGKFVVIAVPNQDGAWETAYVTSDGRTKVRITALDEAISALARIVASAA